MLIIHERLEKFVVFFFLALRINISRAGQAYERLQSKKLFTSRNAQLA